MMNRCIDLTLYRLHGGKMVTPSCRLREVGLTDLYPGGSAQEMVIPAYPKAAAPTVVIGPKIKRVRWY